MTNESIKLYYKDGSSDKAYFASLETKDNGWVVNFQYGKRGSTLKAGTKTTTPVDYAVAKKEYDKLVAEKVGKGYRPETKVSLYYTDASSDKVYLVELKEINSGEWNVEFQYGKRGSTLKAGVKNTNPLGYGAAKQVFDDLVSEKVNKGYKVEGSTGLDIQDVNANKVHSGLTPQLLNLVTPSEGKDLISDSSFMAQEKYDGERRMIRKNQDNSVEGTNRKGFVVPMPKTIESLVQQLNCTSCTLDGEDMGDQGIVLFDILELNGKDLSSLSAIERIKTLYHLVSGKKPELKDGQYSGCNSGKLFVTSTAISKEAKETLLERLKVNAKEGLVFKEVDSAYVPGRPASGGNQLKWKFVESITCMVSGQNSTKRSVGLLLLDTDGKWTDAGNATIPVNHDIPGETEIVELNYLYATKAGILYQPVYKGKRPDQGPEDCLRSQLKYKGEVDLENDTGLNM